jgi:hypothetical protein
LPLSRIEQPGGEDVDRQQAFQSHAAFPSVSPRGRLRSATRAIQIIGALLDETAHTTKFGAY